jgi:hypothetical protein
MYLTFQLSILTLEVARINSCLYLMNAGLIDLQFLLTQMYRQILPLRRNLTGRLIETLRPEVQGNHRCKSPRSVDARWIPRHARCNENNPCTGLRLTKTPCQNGRLITASNGFLRDFKCEPLPQKRINFLRKDEYIFRTFVNKFSYFIT